MTRTVQLALGILVVVAVGAAAVVLTRDRGDDRAANNSSQSTSTSETTNTQDVGVVNGGKPIMCSIMSVSPDVFITGSAYTDGMGKALQTYEVDKFSFGTLITPTKTSTWSTSDVPGGKKGMTMATTSEYGRRMQFKSGETTINGTRARYDCNDWTVDDSIFKLPSNVEFTER